MCDGLNETSMDITISLDGSLTLDDIEDQVILATLKLCYGCRTWTAKRLAISLRTVRNRIKKLKARGYDIPEVDLISIKKIQVENSARSNLAYREELEEYTWVLSGNTN
jgi:hypothetical protein